jgi:hypothetical protein
MIFHTAPKFVGGQNVYSLTLSHILLIGKNVR